MKARLVVIVALLVVAGTFAIFYRDRTRIPHRSGPAWVRADTPLVNVWRLRGSQTIENGAARIDSAFLDLRSWFQQDTLSPPTIVLAASRAHAARLNGGLGLPGSYNGDSHTVVIVGSEFNEILLRHELTHAIAARAWGTPAPSADWINEGLATLRAGKCAGAAPRELAAKLHRMHRLPTLVDLRERFRDISDLESYIAAASIVQWLLDTNDIARLQRLWGGATELLDENAWHAYLAAGPRSNWNPAQGCFLPRGT